ncbi:MAG: response regulator [Desulfobacterales bacterium]
MTTTVHIIDDDESVRRALWMLLESAGFKVKPHVSGEAFFADETAASSDCIITDIRMPGLSGLDLIERLRLQGRNIPVIVISAYDDDHTRRRACKLGAAAFFCKPVDDIELIDAIRRVVATSSRAANPAD